MTMMQTQKMQQEKLQRAIVLEIAKNYCQENGLSFDKLKEQRFYWIYGEAFFAQKSEVKPQGLLNDLETQPKPTLIVKLRGEQLIFEQTEYTKKYLS